MASNWLNSTWPSRGEVLWHMWLVNIDVCQTREWGENAPSMSPALSSQNEGSCLKRVSVRSQLRSIKLAKWTALGLYFGSQFYQMVVLEIQATTMPEHTRCALCYRGYPPWKAHKSQMTVVVWKQEVRSTDFEGFICHQLFITTTAEYRCLIKTILLKVRKVLIFSCSGRHHHCRLKWVLLMYKLNGIVDTTESWLTKASYRIIRSVKV